MVHMCQLDPSKRLSAQEVFNSEWLHATPEACDPGLSSGSSVISNIRKFGALNKFKKEALQIIAHRQQDEDITKLRQAFLRLDSNGDGKLTLQEFKDGLKELETDAEYVFSNLDADCSGFIDYTEFLCASMSRQEYLREEACWDAFRVF